MWRRGWKTMVLGVSVIFGATALQGHGYKYALRILLSCSEFPHSAESVIVVSTWQVCCRGTQETSQHWCFTAVQVTSRLPGQETCDLCSVPAAWVLLRTHGSSSPTEHSNQPGFSFLLPLLLRTLDQDLGAGSWVGGWNQETQMRKWQFWTEKRENPTGGCINKWITAGGSWGSVPMGPSRNCVSCELEAGTLTH